MKKLKDLKKLKTACPGLPAAPSSPKDRFEQLYFFAENLVKHNENH